MTTSTRTEKSRLRPIAPKVAIRNDDLRPQQQRIALLTILGPTLGVIAAIWIAVVRGFTTMDLVFVVIGICLGQLFLEIGYHRLFAHRAFETSRPMRVLLAAGAAMTGQGRINHWIANHRRHHLHSDTPKDPHSPYVRADRDTGEAIEMGMVKGLVHAQWGHMVTDDVPNCTLFARDLNLDADLRWINRHYTHILWAGLVLPALIGFAIAGNLWGLASGFLWGGLVRMFVVQNVTWAVASASHRFGSQPFDCGDRSRNLIWTALPSFGSGYQNNHHTFPRSAFLGFKWWELDVSGLVIRLLAWCRLIWDVTERPTDREMQAKRRSALAGGGSPAQHPAS